MVTRSQASSKPAKRHSKRQQQKEVEVVEIEEAEAPTQVIQSRSIRKSSKPTTGTEISKSYGRAAKKRGSKTAPPPEPEPEQDEDEDEDEMEDDESEHEHEQERTPKRRRTVAVDGPRVTAGEKKLEKEIKRVIKKARESGWGLETLRRQLEEATPARAPARGNEDEEDEVEEVVPIKHHKKERIGPAERKKPSAWSHDEQALLVNLVCEFGAQWSKFERMYGGGRLYGRNQTALKDKARNIMRKIIDNDQEEQWIARYPLWSQVTVGQARRGVHGYQKGKVPVREPDKAFAEMMKN